MKIYLIRHCETKANSEKLYIGHTDSRLSPLGVQQALEIAQKMARAKIDAIFSSDLQRAIDSALPLVKSLNLTINIEPRLRELNFGHIEGLTYAQSIELYFNEMNYWYSDFLNKAPPGGELFSLFKFRVFEFIDELTEKDYKSAAVFTHGGVCRLLIAHATKKDFFSIDPRHGEITEMVLEGSKGDWDLGLLE